MLANVFSGTLWGIDAIKVEVQVDLARGLPAFATVGLPDGAVKESKDRVKAALKNQGYPFPRERVTVNLAPADIRKDGTGYDLPIALGLLIAQGVVDQSSLNEVMVAGELSLDGRIKPLKGALALALAARAAGLKTLILPAANAPEASVVEDIAVRPAEMLGQVVDFLNGKGDLPLQPAAAPAPDAPLMMLPDMAEVKGQEQAKKALIVAAAGGHNILFVGPPGSGKTMLAQRLPSILPPLTFDEAMETTKIYSALGLVPHHSPLLTARPFRSPHHTISDVGLIGGGRFPRPGEVSLAHHGVLFLDELPEFKKNVLEVLRQPLEDGRVGISRAVQSLTFPAMVMLVAAMNPCPCGFLGDPKKKCLCRPDQIQKYRARVSGPLLDRIDLHVEAPAVDFKQLSSEADSPDSKSLRELVVKARKIQNERFKGYGLHVNAQMNNSHLKKWAPLSGEVLSLLETAVNRLNLSARAYTRIIKLARTIADLGAEADISKAHIAEAISYRTLDRNY